MRIPKNLKALTKLFAELGAPDPEGWARSQINEGFSQIARYLFLRQAWRRIVQEGDTGWINAEIAHANSHPGEPYTGAGLALTRLREKGAADNDLTDLVRAMQAQLLFDFCYLLEDPGDLEDSVAEIGWALVQIDHEGTVLESIDGLHESVLETDPTGREVRPRPQA